MHEGRGVVAKVIVQNGTLQVGDAIVCGTATGHVKAMYDTLEHQSPRTGGRPFHAGQRHRLGRSPAGRRALLRARRILPRPGRSPRNAPGQGRQSTSGQRADARDAGNPVRAARARTKCKRST